MSDDGTWLDGNALAGLLAEVFAIEMTTVMRHCPSCGTRGELGAHRAYRGAGSVLRCPGCGVVAMRIATLEDRHVVHFSGGWVVDVPRG